MIPNPLKIFNPTELPFGPLSINSIEPIKIQGVYYKSVAHYMYSCEFDNKFFKQLLNNQTSGKDLKDTFESLLQKEAEAVLSKAIDTAIMSQYSSTPDLAELLYKTGNRVLLYKNTTDSYLGTGPDGKGKNIYGIKLMALRDIVKYKFLELSKIKGEEDLFENAYKIYIVSEYMKRLITYGKDNLERFIGKSALAIYSELAGEPSYTEEIQYTKEEEDYETKGNLLERLKLEYLDYETVVELFKKNNLESVSIELKIPGTLATYHRSLHLNNYYNELVEKKKNIIFDMFTNDVAKTVFGESLEISGKTVTLESYNISKERNQELKKLPYQEKVRLRNRIYSLYENQALPEDIQEKIQITVMEEIGYIPKEYYNLQKQASEEVKGLKAMANDMDYSIRVDVPSPGSSEDNSPIEFDLPQDKFGSFSPNSTSAPFYVDGLFYPSVCHYMVTMSMYLVMNKNPFKKFTIAEIHQLLIANVGGDPYRIENYYSCIELKLATKEIMEQRRYRLAENCFIANTAKFNQHNKLARLLVSTENVDIIYGDVRDNFLGSGPEDQGENIVGKQLMQIRNELKEKGVKPLAQKMVDVVQVEDITKDAKIKEWYDFRLFDCVRSLRAFNQYIKTKYKKNILSTYAVDYVLHNIYANCDDIESRNMTTTEVSQDFDEKLEKMQVPPLTQSSIEIIWKYMRGLIINLDYVTMQYGGSIYTNLMECQKELSKMEEYTCKQIIEINSDYDKILNCILNSVISIIIALSKYSTGTFVLEASDVEFIKKMMDIEVEIDKNKDTSLSGVVYGYLDRSGIQVNDIDVVDSLLLYCIALAEKMPNKRAENRILFFINLSVLREGAPTESKRFIKKQSPKKKEPEPEPEEEEEEYEEEEEEYEEEEPEEEYEEEEEPEEEEEYEEEEEGEEEEEYEEEEKPKEKPKKVEKKIEKTTGFKKWKKKQMTQDDVYVALENDDKDNINKYILNGGDIYLLDDNGNTLLMNAVNGQKYNVAKVLLEAYSPEMLNIQNENGKTALMLAMRERPGTLEIIQLLLKKGADYKLKDKDGKTAKQIAESRRFEEAVDIFWGYEMKEKKKK